LLVVFDRLASIEPGVPDIFQVFLYCALDVARERQHCSLHAPYIEVAFRSSRSQGIRPIRYSDTGHIHHFTPSERRPTSREYAPLDESVQCRGAAATLHNQEPHLALNRGAFERNGLERRKVRHVLGREYHAAQQNPIDAIWE
jgi:hypothetical protein